MVKVLFFGNPVGERIWIYDSLHRAGAEVICVDPSQTRATEGFDFIVVDEMPKYDPSLPVGRLTISKFDWSIPTVETHKFQHELLPGLIAQWNRAKVQKNKNLMRDIEARIKCLRGY